jgi:hypothetical protein
MSEQNIWDDLKELWKNSSKTEKITFQMSNLLAELRIMTSRFEKDSIKRDIKIIKASVSQFEKDSVTRDMQKIYSFFRKIIRYFKGL